MNLELNDRTHIVRKKVKENNLQCVIEYYRKELLFLDKED